ncbi:lipopolysaccharide biosynthesis protein [bacterium]|nr:lipopolysaccharide biosynthesis protein [bacterium]
MVDQPISIRRGLTWILIGQGGRVATQLISLATLVRLLPPTDYGLMAMAATVVALAAMFRDFGTAAALIQAPTVSTRLKQSVFCFNLTIGILVAAATLVLAAPVSMLFAEARLFWVLIALSPVFVIGALGAVSRAMLERESKFRSLAGADVAAGLVGLAVAVVIAVSGGGVYALVGQQLASALVATVAVLWLVSWKPAAEVRFDEIPKIFSFSSNVFLFNIINYFHRSAGDFLIGRYLGAKTLGFYSVANRILMLPLQNVTFAINRASFPVYSRHSENQRALQVHYSETLASICFVIAPALALVWALREPIIELVLGPEWVQIAVLLAWIAPTGFLQSVTSTSGSILNALGRSDLLRNLGVVGVPFLILAMVAGLKYGVEGVVSFYFVANVFWSVPVMAVVFRQLGGGALEFLKSTYRFSALAVILALVTRWAWAEGIWGSLPSLVGITASTIIFSGLYLAIAWACAPMPIKSALARQ